jgi:hypothetical protein
MPVSRPVEYGAASVATMNRGEIRSGFDRTAARTVPDRLVREALY